VLVDYPSLRRLLRRQARGADGAPSGHTRNAVCLLLVDRDETEAVLIQKADTNGYHWRDHVALPGGRIEPADASPQEAALRELHEELGIPRGDVEVVGCLGHFQTRTSKHDLEVIVARWTGRSALQVDPREIARVFEVPLRQLADLHVQAGFRSRPEPELGEALVYALPDAEIWGVTARILHCFLEECGEHLHGST